MILTCGLVFFWRNGKNQWRWFNLDSDMASFETHLAHCASRYIWLFADDPKGRTRRATIVRSRDCAISYRLSKRDCGYRRSKLKQESRFLGWYRKPARRNWRSL